MRMISVINGGWKVIGTYDEIINKIKNVMVIL